MPTGGKGGGGKPTPAQQRALRQLLAKAKASQRQAKVTEAKAQHVNDLKVRKQREAAKKLVREYEAHPHAQEARFGPSTKILSKTVGDLATAAIHAPAGLYTTGKAVGQDVAATHVSKGHKPDFSFKRSRAISKAIGKSTAEDVRHPLRHPGYTLLDALALLS